MSILPPLRIGVSTRALFDMNKEDGIYRTQGVAAFREYQRRHINTPPSPGEAFPLIRKIANLNKIHPGASEISLISRNDPIAGARVLKACRHYGITIDRGIFTNGYSRARYFAGLGINLFLTASESDAQEAIDVNVPAAMIIKGSAQQSSDDILRIALDGDAVIFSDESERIFKEKGLEAFRSHESASIDIPLPDGPFKPFLMALNEVKKFPELANHVRVGVFTARGAEAAERVINTLSRWGLDVDEALFLSGANKTPLLKEFGADIFFDDQEKHCERAAHVVPTGKVPWKGIKPA